jgi:hypothetical protein
LQAKKPQAENAIKKNYLALKLSDNILKIKKGIKIYEMSQKEILIDEIIKYLNSFSDEKLREVYDFVRFLNIDSLDDFILAKSAEVLSQESLRDFLENEPDIYSLGDIKEQSK